jgi:hypothetical protein
MWRAYRSHVASSLPDAEGGMHDDRIKMPWQACHFEWAKLVRHVVEPSIASFAAWWCDAAGVGEKRGVDVSAPAH